jgi:hypothetical protein
LGILSIYTQLVRRSTVGSSFLSYTDLHQTE